MRGKRVRKPAKARGPWNARRRGRIATPPSWTRANNTESSRRASSTRAASPPPLEGRALPRPAAALEQQEAAAARKRAARCAADGPGARTARSGRDSIDHAPGSHDDVVNAAAGALLSAAAPRPKVQTGMIDFARTGRITWKDDEPERRPLRIVTVTEREALRQKGLL